MRANLYSIFTFLLSDQCIIFSFKWDCVTFASTIGLVSRAFANGLGGLGYIPGRVIPKTLKMVLDTFLLNTLQYKVRIKGRVEQSREMNSALPYTSV